MASPLTVATTSSPDWAAACVPVKLPRLVAEPGQHQAGNQQDADGKNIHFPMGLLVMLPRPVRNEFNDMES